MNTIKNYLDYFHKLSFPELFSAETIISIEHIAEKYGDMESEEVAYTIRLDLQEKSCLFSFRSENDDVQVREFRCGQESDACFDLNLQLSDCSEKKIPGKSLKKWLDELVERGLCIRAKADDILKWVSVPPQANPFICNDCVCFRIVTTEGTAFVQTVLTQSVHVSRIFSRFYRPAIMNLELTDRCPLHCLQCYCDLNHGRDMQLETALYWIREAGKEHLMTICLSGGETMVYPHLTELIRECRKYDIMPSIAISGWGITEEKLRDMIDAGIDCIFVSLNGSTEEINRESRDGYALAINAMRVMQKLGFQNVYVNWVMHESNAEDFPAMIHLCETLGVTGLTVMAFKPNAAHELPDEPAAEQIYVIAEQIRKYKGSVCIEVESCFSQLRAILGKRLFMNSNIGINRGCGAGRDAISVSLDGKLTPCRHLDFPEEFTTIADYWENSEILNNLRTMEARMDKNCALCAFKNNCLPCAAVNVKLKGYIGMGHPGCEIWEEERKQG